MSFLIEEGIRPLVEAINRLPFAMTVYSCEGHFERPPDARYLPTAYVTFGITQPRWFIPLYRDLLNLSRSREANSFRLTYDCLLGRYTLSAWAPAARKAEQKREAVSALVQRLAAVALAHADAPIGTDAATSGKSDSRYPCAQKFPPCSLIIPQKTSTCPFTDPPAPVGRPALDD